MFTSDNCGRENKKFLNSWGGSFWLKDYIVFELPYAHHYNPRFVYFYPIFHFGLYCRAGLILQTIYVLNKEILPFLDLKSAVYNREWFQINSGIACTISPLTSVLKDKNTALKYQH